MELEVRVLLVFITTISDSQLACSDAYRPLPSIWTFHYIMAMVLDVITSLL